MDHIPNTDTPLVSFVLPAYKASWISEAIDSILAQTYHNIELIIVNDQSPEPIRDIVAQYDDFRIRYYENEENIGGKSLVAQWEKCISYVKGEYLVIASDDDIYHPRFTTSCLDLAFKYPTIDIVRARTEQINEQGKLLATDYNFPELMNQTEYIYRYRVGSAFICIGNFLFITSTLVKKGIVNFPKALGSDIATTIDLAENGIANTNDILFSFRHSNQHISGGFNEPEKRAKAITSLFAWLKALSYQAPKNKYDEFHLSKLTDQDWDEKCNYDLYNQVFKHTRLTDILFSSYARPLSASLRCSFLLQRFKDTIKRLI